MTLDTALSKALYQGNGSATQFPFAFKVWEPDQIRVTVTGPGRESRDVTSQSRIELTEAGGVVTYPLAGEALSDRYFLSVTRNMPFVQDIDLVSGSKFDPQVIEDGLDKSAAERQQLREQLSRAVILPPTSEQSPEEVVEDIYAARDEAQTSAKAAAQSATAAEKSAVDAAASEIHAKEYQDWSCQCADRAEQARDAALAQAVATNELMAAEMTKINAIVVANKDDQHAAIAEAKAWADSDMPPNPDDPESKSAKTWAKVAEENTIENLPVTSKAQKGLMQVGQHLEVTPEGVVDAPVASESMQGIGRSATTAEVENGVTSENGPAWVRPENLKKKIDPVAAKALGIFNTRLVLTTSNASWTDPVDGWAKVTIIGGGGPGTSWINSPAWGSPGGATSFGDITAQGGATSRALPTSVTIQGRYRIGGGCAGEVKIIYVKLVKGSTRFISIGAGGIAGAGTSTNGYIGNPGTDTINDSSGSAQQAWGGSGGKTGLGFGGGGGGCGLTWGADIVATNPHVPGFGHDGGANASEAAAIPLYGGNGGPGAIIVEYFDPDKEAA